MISFAANIMLIHQSHATTVSIHFLQHDEDTPHQLLNGNENSKTHIRTLRPTGALTVPAEGHKWTQQHLVHKDALQEHIASNADVLHKKTRAATLGPTGLSVPAEGHKSKATSKPLNS